MMNRRTVLVAALWLGFGLLGPAAVPNAPAALHRAELAISGMT